MINPRIDRIKHKLTQLSSECTSEVAFIKQVNRLTRNTKRPGYVKGSYHIDEFIILYCHLSNHIQYLIGLDRIDVMYALLRSSIKLIRQINELNQNAEVDQHKCPLDLRSMALEVIANTKDRLSDEISRREI